MGVLLQNEIKEVFEDFFSWYDWWDMFVCGYVWSCLCVHTTLSRFRANHFLLVFCVYMDWPWPPLASFCPRGCSLPALQPSWCLGGGHWA